MADTGGSHQDLPPLAVQMDRPRKRQRRELRLTPLNNDKKKKPLVLSLPNDLGRRNLVECWQRRVSSAPYISRKTIHVAVNGVATVIAKNPQLVSFQKGILTVDTMQFAVEGMERVEKEPQQFDFCREKEGSEVEGEDLSVGKEKRGREMGSSKAKRRRQPSSEREEGEESQEREERVISKDLSPIRVELRLKNPPKTRKRAPRETFKRDELMDDSQDSVESWTSQRLPKKSSPVKSLFPSKSSNGWDTSRRTSSPRASSPKTTMMRKQAQKTTMKPSSQVSIDTDIPSCISTTKSPDVNSPLTCRRALDFERQSESRSQTLESESRLESLLSQPAATQEHSAKVSHESIEKDKSSRYSLSLLRTRSERASEKQSLSFQDEEEKKGHLGKRGNVSTSEATVTHNEEGLQRGNLTISSQLASQELSLTTPFSEHQRNKQRVTIPEDDQKGTEKPRSEQGNGKPADSQNKDNDASSTTDVDVCVNGNQSQQTSSESVDEAAQRPSQVSTSDDDLDDISLATQEPYVESPPVAVEQEQEEEGGGDEKQVKESNPPLQQESMATIIASQQDGAPAPSSELLQSTATPSEQPEESSSSLLSLPACPAVESMPQHIPVEPPPVARPLFQECHSWSLEDWKKLSETNLQSKATRLIVNQILKRSTEYKVWLPSIIGKETVVDDDSFRTK